MIQTAIAAPAENSRCPKCAGSGVIAEISLAWPELVAIVLGDPDDTPERLLTAARQTTCLWCWEHRTKSPERG